LLFRPAPTAIQLISRAPIAVTLCEGHVVNTASIGGLIAGYGWEISAYIASKFAVVSMSRNLRGELAGSGIGVSVLCPGSVDTRIWEAARNRPAEYGGPEAYDWPDRITRSGPIDPLLVGRHVLRAIREDQFYVITHTEGRAVIDADAREVLDAFDRADRDPLD
ncbi:MAG: SDR family NAD(P)-dependent oxidoreductase, partial [Chloroflexi bacterium]|nr:SDR family NAD(P)-dependent oxidoreductase [Chloroflexota bacterium]